MHPSRNLGHRIDGTEHIGGMRHRHPHRALREQCIERRQFQLQAIAIHFPDFHHRAGLLQTQPTTDIGLVVGVGYDDFVARADAAQDGLRQQKHEPGGGAAHHHFFDVCGIDQLRDGAPRGEHLGRGLLGRGITGAQLHTGGQQVVANAVRHPTQHGRTTGVVQVNRWAGERRKFGAHARKVQWNHSGLVIFVRTIEEPIGPLACYW